MLLSLFLLVTVCLFGSVCLSGNPAVRRCVKQFPIASATAANAVACAGKDCLVFDLFTRTDLRELAHVTCPSRVFGSRKIKCSSPILAGWRPNAKELLVTRWATVQADKSAASSSRKKNHERRPINHEVFINIEGANESFRWRLNIIFFLLWSMDF